MEESKGLGKATASQGQGKSFSPQPSQHCPTSAGMLPNSGSLQQSWVQFWSRCGRYSAQWWGGTSAMLCSVCPRTSPLQGGEG